MATRPTTDRLRETLFNVLSPRMEGARFADLYAGSGAVGIEAMSRGAAHAEFVERAQSALRTIRANLAKLGIRAGVNIHAGSALSWIKRQPAPAFDIVFLDPPYDALEEYEAVLGAIAAVLAPGGIVIAEHRRKDRLAERYGPLRRTRQLQQGDATLSFYAQPAEPSAQQDEPGEAPPLNSPALSQF
jgi:16S rRNA (guanine(966)-N(2))-methyltransferase RsmD